jgi:hypothetical protein
VKKKTAAAAAALALIMALPQVGTAQEAPDPTLRLFSPDSEVKLIRYGSRAPRLERGIWVEAENGAFEIQVRRPDYSQPIEAQQVIRSDAGVTTRPIPPSLVSGWWGFDGFFTMEARDASDAVVLQKAVSFCPNGEDRQRTGDAGPMIPTYPSGCYGQPLTRGVVWGVDEEWAVNALSWRGTKLNLPDGTYDVTIAIAPQYREVFGISEEDGSTTIAVTIETRSRTCRRCYDHAHARRAAPTASRPLPTVEDPDPAILPDLEALPAWGIGVDARKRGDFLRFGATGWVGGASSLVVEGFRRDGEEVMDAYQYFFAGDEVVGRAPVGEFEWDERRGHSHWHFRQFAAYRLLDAEKNDVGISTKEAFCLAPTDPVDLTLPGAVWNTGDLGLRTSCGWEGAIWIRETLPLGWGDTYFQGLPGQSFDVTNLPNGTYYIEVEVNPDGLLHEQSAENNSELREVILKGKPGARRVIVPPWNGIDTEGTLGKFRQIR